MALVKGKKVRVKASVSQTALYNEPDSSIADTVKFAKAGEQIGTITNAVPFEGGDGREYVEVLLPSVSYTGIEEFDVNIVYVLLSDIDVIGEDVDDSDTIVYDRNGNLLEGSAYDYPDAIPTGETRNGKRVFIVKSLPKDGNSSGNNNPTAEPTRPKWLTFALWTLVALGVITMGVVLYKSFSKPSKKR